MSDYDELRAEFESLRSKDSKTETALLIEQAKANLASRATARDAAKPGVGETIARAMGAGATMDFDDEIAGGMGAIAAKIGALDNKEGLSFADLYRQYRGEARAGNRSAEEANPKTYGATKFAAGVVSGMAMPVAKTVGGAAKVGALLGGSAGLGGSEADVTRGEVGRAALDTALGASAGAAAGAAGQKVSNAIGGALSRRAAAKEAAKATGVSAPVAKAASKVAQSIAPNVDEVSQIGVGKTIGEQVTSGVRIQDRVAQETGDSFAFRASQLTGDPEQALAEHVALQVPGQIKKAQAQEAAQLLTASKFLDKQVERIASNPSALGRSNVGDELASTVAKRIELLESARSAAVTPMYAKARASLGGVDAESILAPVRKIIADNDLNPSATVPQLERLLGKLEAKGAGGGLSLDEVFKFRSYLGRVKRGSATFLDGASPEQQGKIASHLLGSIESALDDAAETAGSADGVALFRAANAEWKKHTQEIESMVPQVMVKILDRHKAGAADTIPAMIERMSADEVGTVFRIANKADPVMAKQMRAQWLEDIFVAGGKASAAAPVSRELGVTEVIPRAIVKRLREAEPKLMQAFAGDKEAQSAFRGSLELMQRLAFGPDLRGAQSTPAALQVLREAGIDAAKTAGDASGVPFGGRAASFVARWTAGLFGNPAAMTEALTTKQGIVAMNHALSAMTRARAGRSIAPHVINAIDSQLARLGVLQFTKKQEPRDAAQTQ